MTFQRLVILAGLLLMIVALVVNVPRMRAWLQSNNAQYLINQHNYSEARLVLDRVLASDAENQRARELLAEVEMGVGNFQRAGTVLRGARETAAATYRIGLCEYQSDHEPQAQAEFAKAATHREKLDQVRRTLAREAARELSKGGTADLPEATVANPLDRMLWNGIRGRSLFHRGLYEESRGCLESALKEGDRTTMARFLACAGNAVLGDYARAQFHADSATSRSEILNMLSRELCSETQACSTVGISMHQAVEQASRHTRLMRAALWATLRSADDGLESATRYQEALAAAENLLRRDETDIPAQVFRAEALEGLGRASDAYRQYEKCYRQSPSFFVLLRMEDLAGTTADIGGRKAEFLSNPAVVAFIDAKTWSSSQTVVRRDALAFLTHAVATAEIAIPPGPGSNLTLVARGDRAFGLSPVVVVRVGNETPEELYIAREGWDCYPLHTVLAPGAHHLELEYVNNSERLLSRDEDRNFYLQGIIVTRAGERQVE